MKHLILIIIAILGITMMSCEPSNSTCTKIVNQYYSGTEFYKVRIVYEQRSGRLDSIDMYFAGKDKYEVQKMIDSEVSKLSELVIKSVTPTDIMMQNFQQYPYWE